MICVWVCNRASPDASSVSLGSALTANLFGFKQVVRDLYPVQSDRPVIAHYSLLQLFMQFPTFELCSHWWLHA